MKNRKYWKMEYLLSAVFILTSYYMLSDSKYVGSMSTKEIIVHVLFILIAIGQVTSSLKELRGKREMGTFIKVGLYFILIASAQLLATTAYALARTTIV